MAVSNDFSASELDLNGQVAINSPTALVWGVDGRLYVTEVDGDVKILTVAFGDKDPADDDPTASFHVTAAETVGLVKAIQNHNDDGSISTGSQRQVTGIDVTPQFDADGNPVMIDGKPAVVMYVTSSDSRIGAGGSGNDANLDTNSGVITRLVQTEDGWDAVDIVRGLARSEENHATNGLEVIQEIDPDTGMLISERMIVANGGNANTGAPSNNFAGQQEQPLSAAILEIDLDEIRAIEAADGLKLDNGRAYVYDLPTLDDPTRDGDDANDPFGGNDGVNSAKLIADGPVQIYSAGYRNAYDVEVTEDGRVWTYDNGANNNWGGRPAGEDSDGDTDSTEAAELAGPPEGYIATNLFVEDNSEIAGNYNPQNWDQMHEITRSDDLNGRSLSAGLGGALTYQWDHPDFDEPLTLVYGGHANPTRAEGSRAGILYTPTAGVDGAKLMVSNLDRGDGRSDFLDVVEWFQEIGYTDAFIANTVVALNPGTRYADEFVAGYTLPTTTGVYSLVEDASGPVGLPSDIAEIVHQVNEIEGDYREPGFTDGAIDTGKGSVNGLAEYTSSIFDDAGQGTMQGALFAASLNQGQYYIIGRDEDGIVQTATTADRTVAADKGFVQSGGAPLGVASIGDDLSAFGNNAAFQGSIWGAIYKQNGPVIEILQPGNADTNPLLGVNFYAGQEPFDPVDNDLDGVDHLNDPFEFDADNGLELTAGERLELNFSQVDLAANPEFSGTIGDTGLLGAALDGTTPNRDAITEADGAAPADRIDGLFDNAGNIIPGGNAPILQIKDVQDGTAIGAANTLRDGLHTGVRIADDVQRMVAEVDIANWWNDQSGGGRITGLTFGDGTQSNFIRFVFGDIGGQLGLELGVETGDSYAVLATVTDADFLTALTDGDAGTLRGKLVTLQLEISDIGGDYAISARYRAGEGASFTEVSVDAAVPAGVLRDVLDGTHTISDGDTTLPSGAAIGIVAQKDDGVSFTAVDFHEIRIEGFGNEIEVSDASAANAQTGTAGTDTLIYTGDDTAPVTLQPGVENIDASGTTGSFAITGNDQANVVTVGAGANTVTTGAGADVVRGTLADLNGDMITDFSNEDALLIEGFSSADIDEIGYSSGSLVLTINGQQITLDGENFADTTDEDAADRVNLTDTADGLRITARAPLEPVVAINAGGTGTFTGTLRDTTLTFYGDEGGAVDGPGFTTPGATKAYPSGGPGGFDFPGTDLDQLLGTERSNGSAFGYDIPVANGTYLIDFIFAEIYWGGGSFPGGGGDGSRVFDINVEGQVAFTDVDIHAEAGGNGIQLVKTYEVEVTDGTLNIEIPPASSDQGKLSGMVVWSTSGAYVPPPDAIAPVIEDISLENPQNFGDGDRALTVVLTDETGFDIDDFAGLDGSEITFDGITPDAISAPTVALSTNGMTATLTYQVTGEGNAWVDGTTGTIQIDAGAFSDAGGNGTAAASAGFVVQSNLDALVRGEVLRAINIGTTDTTAATNLGGDPLDGGAVDNNRYGGAIAADSLITDAFGNPVAFEADNAAYHSSPKANGALNANVDGQSGSTGSNAGGIDLDGSAYHTYRDSTAGSWTSTFDGFANGTYVVELHFAELFQTAANTRVGDFTVNGVVFGDDYDAFAAAQGGAGADKPSFIRKAVTVTDGTIQVLVDDVSAGQPGYSAIVVYEALDPDLPPTLSVGDITVVEGETAEITITRLGDLSEAVTVDVALTPGTADAADIGAASATQVTFAANQTVATITLPIIDDDDEEGAETIGVTLSNATGSAVIANGTATITIAASDSGIQAPVGTTIFELDFEGGEGEAIAIGGFDGTLGDEALTLDEATSQVTGGKLVVQTAEGDINDGADNGSINDFTKTVDLSDPAMTEIYLTSRFDNPFTEDVLIAQGITDGRLPNYAQQGLVFGTGSQAAANMVKLVWGAVAAGAAAPDAMGVQMWSKAGGLDQKVLLADMLAEGLDQFDVASVEMSLVIDKAAGTVGQYVTLFDAAGTIIGGVRPVATAGFATAAPVGMPAAVLANLTSTTEATHVGVTSSDNSIGEGAFTSFEASWDFLRLSSPQYAGGPEPDADGPTASVSIEAPALDADPIVVSVAYADASDIDPATIDAGDVVLTGPTAPGAVTVAFDAETNVATYSFAAPEGGWAEGEYGATVAAAEVADLAASPNANTGGENAIATLSFEDEPVPEYTAGEIALAINAGGPAMTMEGIAFESGQGATEGPFFGGLIYTDPSTGSSGNGPQPIFDGTVYKTEINGNSDGDFTFSAAVDSEKLYFVDLYLAELYASQPGQRIFDVFVEGGAEPVLNDYDILAVNGGDINKPVVVRLATPIAPGENGQIDLSFVAVTDRAKVSAIVIREAVPVGPDTLISVSGPGEVLETGDGADQMVAFTLTASDAALTGDVDMTVQVDGVTSAVTVAFTDGVATFEVAVPTDTRWNGAEAVAFEVISVESEGISVDAGAAAATATVTEDDPADSHDLSDASDPVVAGDYSDDRLAPSDIGAMQQGENILYATQQGDAEPGARDRDYITFEVPEGMVLSALFLDGYVTTEVAGQAFMGLQVGNAVTVDPLTGEPDAGSEGLLAGIVYGDGNLNGDLLELLAAGDPSDAQGADFPGFDGVLTAGTYTLWLNQGGPSTSVTLRAVVEPAPIAALSLSIGDATVTEAEGASLDFAITTDQPFTGQIELTFDTATETGLTQIVDMTDGAGILSLPVADDDVDDGDEQIDLTITAAVDQAAADPVAITLADAVAVGTITEDDGIDPADIDGDGILNQDDPFAYDASNGMDRVLGEGVTFRQDFDTDTDDVFEAGFTGIIVNQGLDPAGMSADDPYGDRTTEGTSLVEDGVLKIESSETDLYDTGTGASNTVKDNYHSGVDVSDVDSFTIEGRVQGGWLGTVPQQYASFGITVGAGGTDDYVKFVISGFQTTPRLQLSNENSLTGAKEQNIILATQDPEIVEEDIASVIFRIEVDKSGDAPSLTATAILLDASDAELATISTGPRAIVGSLAAAMEGNNPLTGGTGGIAYGVSITDWSNGAGNRFTGEWDYLEISGPEAADAPPVVDQGIAPQAIDEDAPFSFVIPEDAFADDGGAANLVLTATLAGGGALPDWLVFDPETGSFSGTPEQADVGQITVEVSASDGVNAPVATQFTLDVTEVNDAPTAAPIDAGSVAETGAPVAIDLLEGAADSDGGTLAVANVTATAGDPAQPVTVTQVDSVLTVDPAQFADLLATGESVSVTVAYEVTDGQGGVTANVATLLVEGLDGPFTWYVDADGDGYGLDDAATNQTGYDQPDGTAALAGDADDADATVYPGAPEIEDGKDNDQDGEIDEGFDEPAEVTPILFQAGDLSSYDRQDKNPTGAAISGDGSTLTLTGNTWKKLALAEAVTVETGSVLRVTFSSDVATEISAVGLDTDSNLDTLPQALFTLAGTQDFAQGDQTYDTYQVGDGPVTFELSLDAWAGETFQYLVFVNDADSLNIGTANGVFSDVAIVGPGAVPNSAPVAVADSLTATEDTA
ncbi:malectin domain-containing carbohydrate-binding protein, partial [Paracoccus sp. C2R09]